MKQSLQLRLGQQLTMTPQLQQAIRLLQLSTLDLQMEIQQQLESNVMLELAEEDQQTVEPNTDEQEREPQQEAEGHNEAEGASDQEGGEAGSATEEQANQEQADIPEDLPLDSSWDEIYDGSTPWSQPDNEDEDRDPYANRAGGGETLHEHLTWQAELTPFTERDAAIAQVIIDAVRDDGYLAADVEELLSALPAEWAVEPDEVEAVLRRIQHFDPVGVAARDPREALLIQLEQLPPDTPLLAEARRLVDQHLDLLVQRQYAQLCRRMKLSQDQLREVLALIQTLDPRPGSQISRDETQYVAPDVVVRRIDGRWQVELNPETAPRLRVNSYYASLIKRADNSSDNTTLRNHLQEARWFIKSLRSRNDTLLKVARCIVERQQGYFDHGEEAMQPLVLREVAEAVDMHESTISRITTRKYMHTPRGTLEFKYFFSSHVQTVDGGECSATAIRARIRRLIADENPSKPLSDSRIANVLQEEGINVARRTVAKYREAMAIASSSERKRLA